MAASENQGLQIALIVLFIVLIILSLATFSFFTSLNDANTRAKTESERATQLDQANRKAAAEINKLKEWIGLSTAEDDPELANAQKTFDEDKKSFSTLPEEKRVYRQAIVELTNSKKAVDTELAAVKDELLKEQAKTMANIEATKTQIAAFEAEKKKAVDDLEAQRVAFMDASAKAEDEKKNLLAKLEEEQKTAAAKVEEAGKTIEQLKKDVAACQAKNVDLTATIARLRGETYSVDDGEIRAVNQRMGTVWINLGRSDALRRQITFTVHSPDSKAGDPDGKKGQIEVTQILGDHMAEARILDSTLANPLLPGDKIYTPLWDPGRPERFAIAGKIDIDGDGKDDRDQLKSIIALSGGTIDAELSPEGNLTGAISSDTRYLIEGPPQDKARTAFEKLAADAKLMGVERIGIDKFLDHIGWRAGNELVRFGTNSNIDKYAGEQPDGGKPVSPGRTSDLFKTRRPPGSQPASTKPATTAPSTGGRSSAYYRF